MHLGKICSKSMRVIGIKIREPEFVVFNILTNRFTKVKWLMGLRKVKVNSHGPMVTFMMACGEIVVWKVQEFLPIIPEIF